MMASELGMEKFHFLFAYFWDDDFIRTSLFIFFQRYNKNIISSPFHQFKPYLGKKNQEETINWRVLLLEPSQGKDMSPLSIQLLKAAAGSVMNSVVWRLGLPGRGSNGGLESKPLSEGVREQIIRTGDWEQAAERDV